MCNDRDISSKKKKKSSRKFSIVPTSKLNTSFRKKTSENGTIIWNELKKKRKKLIAKINRYDEEDYDHIS